MEERILYLESLSPEYFRGGIVSIKTAIVHFKKVKYYFIMILVKMLFSLRMYSDFFPPYFCQEKNSQFKFTGVLLFDIVFFF